MSETEKVVNKVKPFLAKYGLWIVLAFLLIAGCYLTASYLWRQAHSEEEAKE